MSINNKLYTYILNNYFWPGLKQHICRTVAAVCHRCIASLPGKGVEEECYIGKELYCHRCVR